MLGLLGSREVLAQEDSLAPASNGDGFDTKLWRPAIDSKGFFTTNGANVQSANSFSFGLVIDYANTIMRTTSSAPPPDGHGVPALLEHVVKGTLTVNYGIANRFVVGLSAPVVLGFSDAAYNIGPDSNKYDTNQINSQGISNIALHGKWKILRPEDGFGLALLVQVGIPFEGPARDGLSDPGFWYWPQLIGDVYFGPGDVFRFGINAGLRGNLGEGSSFGNELLKGNVTHGNLGTYNAAFSWRATRVLDLVAETYGTYLLSNESAEAQRLSGEISGGIKVFVEERSFLMLGASTRAFYEGYQSSNVRGFVGFVYEPSIGDRDGDGIPDDIDQCPDNPEDLDKFEDSDGCPDPDNDKDGILDVNDACPNQAETFNGYRDEDGCPDIDIRDHDGDGIPDKLDKCPDEPEDFDKFEDEDGCPDPDNDKDGILDKVDQCPNSPEDFDGFEDEDGCPEPDNDNDGIMDVVDKCPNEPETFNGFEDEDGCPDKGKVIVDGDEIIILEKVQFATGSAEILPGSFAILDAVSSTLNHYPDMQKIEVAGHADERGDDEKNLKLTQERAAAVASALAQRGVTRDRLVSQGYGEYCPIDPGHGGAAWEKNRRVEFKVVKTKTGSTRAARGCPEAVKHGVNPPKLD